MRADVTPIVLTFLQARFALTSAQVFSHTDLTTDSKRFYNSILELLDDPDEKGEVNQLMMWWNWWDLFCNYWSVANEDISQIFPLYSDVERFPSKDSALSRIHAKWAEYNERNTVVTNGSDWQS